MYVFEFVLLSLFDILLFCVLFIGVLVELEIVIFELLILLKGIK